jgi:hypothetical protein
MLQIRTVSQEFLYPSALHVRLRILSIQRYREVRLDLSLPGFTATDLSYPEFLPSPPPAAIRTQDQSWYFYLAEIALRRLANSILTEVLPLSNPQRSTHLREYAAMVPSFENQAENW